MYDVIDRFVRIMCLKVVVSEDGWGRVFIDLFVDIF